VAWCVLRPEERDWLESLGLTCANDFLRLPGVVVSGHVGRNVSRVRIGGRTAYLKREHRVRLRDRFRAWRDGFGWVSMSEREAAVLRRLDECGLPGPSWLAYGEANDEGFLLLADAGPARLLSAGGPVSRTLAARLGEFVARLHAAGIDQKDLFAKHILVRPGSDDIIVLDWQRAVVRANVPWVRRVRGLAALQATSPAGVFAQETWDVLLTAYLANAGGSGLVPSLAELRASLELVASRLCERAGFRRAGGAAVEQELVRIDGETVCAVPAAAGCLDSPPVIAALYDPANDGRTMAFGIGATGRLVVSRYRSPIGRWWAAIRQRAWRSPELRTARLLLHLERHGIPAPRLIAYGQTSPSVRTAGAFVFFRPVSARPVTAHDAPAVRNLFCQLHAAGVHWRGSDCPLPFGIADGTAVVTDPRALSLTKRLGARQVARDFRRLDAYFRNAG
jgi:tRNA A-37 threonylcarbamoyl transferase component Bud32